MSKHYVIVAHGRIMPDQKIIFSPPPPINKASQLYFYVNEGCILSTYPRPGESDPSSEIKKTICNPNPDHKLEPKYVIQYGESYPHMLLSPFIKSSEIVIQNCSSRIEENIIKIKEQSYLYNIINQIESYHKHNYPTEPYILHIFACLIYHGNALPAPALVRSISGNHDEQIIFYFTDIGYATYIQTILDLHSPDLKKEELINYLSGIMTKEKQDIIKATKTLRINSDDYDKLVKFGEQLGLKKKDIDLNMIKQSLEKKRGSEDPFFHPIPVSSQLPGTASTIDITALPGPKRVKSYEQKYIKYKTKYLNLKNYLRS